MPGFIKLIDGADAYYMEWSGVSDSPASRGMPLAQFRRYWEIEYGRRSMDILKLALERADMYGSSSYQRESAEDVIDGNRAGRWHDVETELTREEILNVWCRPAEQRARALAYKLHEGQRYGERPYREHLHEVRDVLARFAVDDDFFLAAGWLHDALEDTGLTVEQLWRNFPEEVCKIVEAVTDGPGDTRAKRKRLPLKQIPKVDGAIVVKLADRIANVEACIRDGNAKLLDMYRGEHAAFNEALSGSRPVSVSAPMWKRLRGLLSP